MNLSKLIRKVTRRSTRSATRVIEYADLASTLAKEDVGALPTERAGDPLKGLNKVDMEAIEESKQEVDKIKGRQESINIEKDVINIIDRKGQGSEIPKLGRGISESAQAEEESSPGVYEVRKVFGGIKKLFESLISRVPMRIKYKEGIKKSRMRPEIMKTSSTLNNILNKTPVIDQLRLVKSLESEGDRNTKKNTGLQIIDSEEHDKRRHRVTPIKQISAQLENEEIASSKLLREADKMASQKKKVKRDREKGYEDFYFSNAGTSLLWECR